MAHKVLSLLALTAFFLGSCQAPKRNSPERIPGQPIVNTIQCYEKPGHLENFIYDIKTQKPEFKSPVLEEFNYGDSKAVFRYINKDEELIDSDGKKLSNYLDIVIMNLGDSVIYEKNLKAKTTAFIKTNYKSLEFIKERGNERKPLTSKEELPKYMLLQLPNGKLEKVCITESENKSYAAIIPLNESGIQQTNKDGIITWGLTADIYESCEDVTIVKKSTAKNSTEQELATEEGSRLKRGQDSASKTQAPIQYDSKFKQLEEQDKQLKGSLVKIIEKLNIHTEDIKELKQKVIALENNQLPELSPSGN